MDKFSNISKDIDVVFNEISDLKMLLNNMNLDNVIQGSNNKYIVNDIYNSSLLVNGTITAKNTNLIELDHNYYSTLYQSYLNYNKNESNILVTEDISKVSDVVDFILGDKNYEEKINKIYEILSYSINSETRTITNDIFSMSQEFISTSNTQANEISLLKNNIENLMNRLQTLESKI